MTEKYPIDDVYRSFLQKISDYKLLVTDDKSEEVILGMLYGYFKSARAKFPSCRTNLETTKDETTGDIFFNEKPSDLEVEILALKMIVEYMRPVMLRNETLEQTVSDSDFKLYSQANHINQLKDAFENIKKEANVLMNNYTFGSRIYGK